MPKTETETIIFLLQCLSSATQNAGKIDYKAIGAQQNATGNAAYLRLCRVKKSVAFKETTGLTTTSNSSPDKHNTTPTPKDHHHQQHPYAPTAPPVSKTTTTTGKKPAVGNKKRKIMHDEAENQQEEDSAASDEVVKDRNKAKKVRGDPKTETAAQEKRRLKKNLLAGFDVHAANLAAVKAANEAVPIVRYEG